MKKTVLLGMLAAVMLFGIAGLAAAESVTYDGTNVGPGIWEAKNDPAVDVKATVNPKITLTVDTPDDSQEVLFGDVYPGTAVTADVDLEVKSNKAWSMVVVQDGDDAELGLSTTAPASIFANYGDKGERAGTDTYTVDVPWDTDPGDYVATVQYTVTQN